MHHCILHTLQRIECLLYYMFPGLCQHLYCHIVGYQILIYELSQKLVFRLRSCRKSYFYLLEADLHQIFEKFHLFIKAHGNDEGLIAVSQIHAAPYRCFLYVILFHPAAVSICRREISHLVFLIIFHDPFIPPDYCIICYAKKPSSQTKRRRRKLPRYHSY